MLLEPNREKFVRRLERQLETLKSEDERAKSLRPKPEIFNKAKVSNRLVSLEELRQRLLETRIKK